MPEYLVKRYVTHYALSSGDGEIDGRMQQDMNELAAQNWTVSSMATTNDPGEARTVVVTYERKN